MALRHVFTVIDCNDLDAITLFWSKLMELEVVGEAPGYRWLTAPAEGSPVVAFQQVPEPKLGKNRVHLDLHTDELGAVEGSRHAWDDFHWVVLGDPEGNEFCIAGGGPAPW